MTNKFTKEDFIKRSIEKHGNKYDYSKVEYKNKKEKVLIICPIHGEFWQLAQNHMAGSGCEKCMRESRRTKIEDFIEKANAVHENKYDYSKVEYINNSTKVKIICPIHGEFEQTPRSHLSGRGCHQCGIEKNANSCRMTFDDFVKRAKEIHGDKYEYYESEFKGSSHYTLIYCKNCNIYFKQKVCMHLFGQGCSECNRITFDDFMTKSKESHGDKYDYSKVEYINTKHKVCIICPIHGEFLQNPLDHMNGCGCPKCKSSKIELNIQKILKENDINFEYQKKFDWLGRLSLDFYLPKYNIAIECQGEQHYKPIKHFGGEKRLKEQIERDKSKKDLCEQNNVKLLYFANEKYEDNIIIDENDLLKEIMS
ncbi:MAG: hypothetical protein IKT40_00390 [Bacilli bacterium]|nr:hypothetical protein [Bacilli bacterium]